MFNPTYIQERNLRKEYLIIQRYKKLIYLLQRNTQYIHSIVSSKLNTTNNLSQIWIKFTILYKPPEFTFWENSLLEFDIWILKSYPFKVPIINCRSPIYHPNFSLNGNMCSLEKIANFVNNLQFEKKYDIAHILFYLNYVFRTPVTDIDDDTNERACYLFCNDRKRFEELSNDCKERAKKYLERKYKSLQFDMINNNRKFNDISLKFDD
ncbi:hypothetical protein ABK040_010365 [Willaertia magna]